MTETPSAWALARAKEIPGISGFYGPARSDVARALDAAYRAGVAAACSEVEGIVRKWSPRYDLWNDIPYEPADMQSIILGNINRIRALSAPENIGGEA